MRRFFAPDADTEPDRVSERSFFIKKDTFFSAKINSNGEKKRKKHFLGLKTAPDDVKFFSCIFNPRTSRHA